MAEMRKNASLALQTVARYVLAAGVMPYGISKLLDFQFQVGASNYSKPLGAASGKILTWAFLGYSPWFQCLLGALEVIPGLLLFFRRTRHVGALLLFPVLLNVALMNFAMDLWSDTKIISLVLLTLNAYLLACDLPLYSGFLRTLWQQTPGIEQPRWKLAANIAEILIPAVILTAFCYYFFASIATMSLPLRDFVGDRQINRAGSWSIQKIAISGHEVSSGTDAFLYFDFFGRCDYVAGSQRLSGKFKADRSHRTFELSGIAINRDSRAIKGTYIAEGEELTLNGHRDNQPVNIILRRSQWGRMLP